MTGLAKEHRVAVIGAGTMGAGIAQVAAQAGHCVHVYDMVEGAAMKAITGICAALADRVKTGKLKDGTHYIATIEPWHGNQVVVYTQPAKPGQSLWQRHVIDESLRWGHGVWCADLGNDGADSLIIGVRDDLSKDSGQRRGVRVYKPLDNSGANWARQIIEDGGMAVEDLAAADLNGDGRIDIVAVGRQTHNIRIYWNTGSSEGK